MMIRSLVQEQPVLAAMPRQVIERAVALGSIRILPVRLPYAPLPVGITRHADREPEPAAERFLKCLRAAALRIRVPASVISVSIFADSDENYCGQAAAYQLADRLAAGKRKRAVAEYVPREPGADFLDVYFARKRLAA